MFESLFGSELPLALRFIIAALIATVILVVIFVVIASVVNVFRARGAPRPIKSIRHAYLVRRAVIRVGEGIAVLCVVVLTIGGILAGGMYAHTMASFSGSATPEGAAFGGAVIGGLAGFLFSVVLTALVFALTGIERNTRQTALLLELIALKGQEE